ncbi:MAG: hypothetical protein JO290_10355 [Sphingomonadaceae bacterium]|nr:hypothetical protein [Sphingomonadaceae bacterium]
MRTLILAVTAVTALTATAADAAGWRASHPRRAEVNGRLENQGDRIAAGRRDGQLTAAEAHSLRADDRRIRSEERLMARNDGGHITKADQRALNQQENANSRAIYADRHN